LSTGKETSLEELGGTLGPRMSWGGRMTKEEPALGGALNPGSGHRWNWVSWDQGAKQYKHPTACRKGILQNQSNINLGNDGRFQEMGKKRPSRRLLEGKDYVAGTKEVEKRR